MPSNFLPHLLPESTTFGKVLWKNGAVWGKSDSRYSWPSLTSITIQKMKKGLVEISVGLTCSSSKLNWI